jgi:hypothetical protein
MAAKEPEKKYWLSPVEPNCEFCGTAIKKKFYDARIRTAGGTICGTACPSCFTLEGIGLGLGRGQEYTLQADGRWLKTGG